MAVWEKVEVENERRKREHHSQPFQRRLNIRKLEEDGFVWNLLIVQNEADAPDYGGEADVLGVG